LFSGQQLLAEIKDLGKGSAFLTPPFMKIEFFVIPFLSAGRVSSLPRGNGGQIRET
jgi:hypothetical protein